MLCAPGGIADMGLAILGLQEALEKAEVQFRNMRDRLQVSEGLRANTLQAWYRQWWILVPLGVLSGVALTLSVQAALE
jgi:hypothetical protein